MSESNITPEPAAAEAPVDPNEIAVESTFTSTSRVPGAAVETVQDKIANDAVRAEPQPEPYVRTPLPAVDTQDPVANLLSRDNIVPSGPGSVEDFLPAA
jgi:hypothetical protein